MVCNSRLGDHREGNDKRGNLDAGRLSVCPGEEDEQGEDGLAGRLPRTLESRHSDVEPFPLWTGVEQTNKLDQDQDEGEKDDARTNHAEA